MMVSLLWLTIVSVIVKTAVDFFSRPTAVDFDGSSVSS